LPVEAPKIHLLEETNISRLPDDIHRMKFLQHILIRGSVNLENLSSSIKKLSHLRTLNIYDSNINVTIPKEFGGLENLRGLVRLGRDRVSFPA
jgi:Leucine-rich repeat (LRR) protein